MAEKLVERYHGKKIARETKDKFESVFSKKELPEDMEEKHLPTGKWNPTDLLVYLKCAPSKSIARGLLRYGAVEIDGGVVAPAAKEVNLKKGSIIKVGKRDFIKIGSVTG